MNKPFVIGEGLRGSVTRVWEKPQDVLEAAVAAAAILKKRSSIASEVLEAMGYEGMVIPKQSFNDDDLYVWNTETLELIQNLGKQRWGWQPPEREGESFALGMTAKHKGIWRIPRG